MQSFEHVSTTGTFRKKLRVEIVGWNKEQFDVKCSDAWVFEKKSLLGLLEEK